MERTRDNKKYYQQHEKALEEVINLVHRLAPINMKEQVRNDVRYRNGLMWILLETWTKNQGKNPPMYKKI